MRKKVTTTSTKRKTVPPVSAEENDRELIALANELVRQRLIDGTASSQEVTHFLKLGSEKERLEKERLKKENELLIAKTERLKSEKRVEELYLNALNAMRNYNGSVVDKDDLDDYVNFNY